VYQGKTVYHVQPSPASLPVYVPATPQNVVTPFEERVVRPAPSTGAGTTWSGASPHPLIDVVYLVSSGEEATAEEALLKPVYKIQTRKDDVARDELKKKRARNDELRRLKKLRTEVRQLEMTAVKADPDAVYPYGHPLYRFRSRELSGDYTGLRSSHTEIRMGPEHVRYAPDDDGWTRDDERRDSHTYPERRVPNKHDEHTYRQYDDKDPLCVAADCRVGSMWSQARPS
jgi:hypothetical protein